ncbi:MAG TPA: M20 family metallo-hydrolase [Cytophagales bacterium]|nr:M20 family metallo-hydrolase [Cytophagales bacterium]
MASDDLYLISLQLLKDLIETQSFSREEENTALLLENFFKEKSISCHRSGNNIWAFNKSFNPSLPTILLNSHHDTVKPNSSWTLNPFNPEEKDGKLYGLGSNDAGGCLVSLAATFLHFYDRPSLKYNLVFASTAEEEISGANGIASIIPQLPEIYFAIIGEPTEMDLAVAEKGLIVVDCEAQGKAGHAARNEGINAIYQAFEDIHWIQNYKFPKESEWLGPVKMQVTVIESGTKQHNVVPDKCTFTIDIRTTDTYSNEEVIKILNKNIKSVVKPRSLRLQPSFIDIDHPFIQSGIEMGMKPYGSPTLSDQALIKCPSVKVGPGKSERSHTADEFIELKEIKEGIEKYIGWLSVILF